jgi:hypothetical protein
MHTNRPGCCLPKLIGYSMANIGVMAALGASTASLCDVSFKVSVVFAAIIGGVWPIIGKLSECCFDIDSTSLQNAPPGKALALASSVYVSSSVVSAIATKSIYDDFSYESAAKLSAANLGGLVVVLAVSALGTICIVTQCIHAHTRRLRQKEVIHV